MNQVKNELTFKYKVCKTILEKHYGEYIIGKSYTVKLFKGEISFMEFDSNLEWGSNEYVCRAEEIMEVLKDLIKQNDTFFSYCKKNRNNLAKNEYKLLLDYAIAVHRFSFLIDEVHYIKFEMKDDELKSLN